MKKPLLFAITAIIILGCSSTQRANKHLRKAQKHIQKAELLGSKWVVDTVYNEISIIRPEIRHDTILSLVGGDTVTIEKERLRIKILRLPGDSIFVDGQCKADTIIKEVPVTVTRTIHAPPKNGWRTAALAFAGVIVLILFVLGYLVRR